MNTKNPCHVLFLIIGLATVLYIVRVSSCSRYEGFYDLTPQDPKCLDCYYKKGQECLGCANCGICIRGNFASCVPGDAEGPYFTEECQKWVYKDHKSGTIDGEPEVIKTRPWNWFNPQQNLTKWPSPVFRSTLDY